MTFPAQTDSSGNPTPLATFVNATLVSALYHRDQRPFQQWAQATESELVAFESDPSTFRPDYAVLIRPGEAYVVLDGTTNAAQWLAHCESALFPLIDTTTGNTVVGSFYAGLREIEEILNVAIAPARNGRVIIAAHSYGAGAAKLWADHLRISVSPPSDLTLFTFGEPKSSGDFSTPPAPYRHLRIVGRNNDRSLPNDPLGLDPVSFMPPGALQCLKWPLAVSIPLSFLKFKFQYFGQTWGINDFGMSRITSYDNFLVKFDLTGWLYLLENGSFTNLHLMDGWYLPKALKLWQTSQQQQM